MITATIVLCPYCGGRTWQKKRDKSSKKCYIKCCECGKKLEEWEDAEETQKQNLTNQQSRRNAALIC